MLPQEDEEKHYELIGYGTKYNQHWNIAGELYGAAMATKWCIECGYTHLDLYYDYEGVEKWVTNQWKRKNELSKNYTRVMNEYRKQIKITFHKVKAHTGDRFNEIADKLAKSACQQYRMEIQEVGNNE